MTNYEEALYGIILKIFGENLAEIFEDGCYFDSTGKMEIVIEELLKRVMEMEEDHDFGA